MIHKIFIHLLTISNSKVSKALSRGKLSICKCHRNKREENNKKLVARVHQSFVYLLST